MESTTTMLQTEIKVQGTTLADEVALVAEGSYVRVDRTGIHFTIPRAKRGSRVEFLFPRSAVIGDVPHIIEIEAFTDLAGRPLAYTTSSTSFCSPPLAAGEDIWVKLRAVPGNADSASIDSTASTPRLPRRGSGNITVKESGGGGF